MIHLYIFVMHQHYKAIFHFQLSIFHFYQDPIPKTKFLLLHKSSLCTFPVFDFFHAQTGSFSNLTVLPIRCFRYPVVAVQKSAGWRRLIAGYSRFSTYCLNAMLPYCTQQNYALNCLNIAIN